MDVFRILDGSMGLFCLETVLINALLCSVEVAQYRCTMQWVPCRLVRLFAEHVKLNHAALRFRRAVQFENLALLLATSFVLLAF